MMKAGIVRKNVPSGNGRAVRTGAWQPRPAGCTGLLLLIIILNLYFSPSAVTTAAGVREQSSGSEEEASDAYTNTDAALSAYADETALPAAFDWRNEGKAPLVRSQGELGTCWALTAASALEAAGLPQERTVYAADHFSFQSGFDLSQEAGGDYRMIMAYLSGWYGPVTEEQDPYGDGESPEGLEAAVHVQEMRLLDGASLERFKEAILRSGPVQTSLYMTRRSASDAYEWYEPGNAAYYCPESLTVNHDVLLLGWDDTFPAESFRIRPPTDGAFICQNTWGTDFGENGIFYVSYADPNIAGRGLVYSRVESADDYARIAQADVRGWQARQGYGRENCLMANVYTAREGETLEAMGFYSTGTYTSYDLYLVHNFKDTDSFNEKIWLTSGALTDIGYFTVELPEPCPLADGERFAVAAEVRTEGSKLPVAVEMMKDDASEADTRPEPAPEGGETEVPEGYISLYGTKWECTEEKYETNVCLKAYLGRENQE